MSDVAARAGVSTQTVSRVLRGIDPVAAGTAARVRSAMAELGYHGNAAAGALKRGQTRTFGLLLPLLTMSIWADVAAGAEALAHASGFSLLLCDTSDSLEKEDSYISLLLSHRVAGIVYALPHCRPEREPACANLVQSSIPVVVISSDQADLPYCHVRTNDVRAGYVAVNHLLDLGRRRIALVGSAAHDPSRGAPFEPALFDRASGARAALQEAGLAADETLVLLAANTLAGGHGAAEALLAADHPLPDGIFATTDAVALGLLETLRAHEVRVPDDIAVVSHDDLLAASVTIPSLSTIAPPASSMGRACIDLLMRAVTGESLPPLHMLEAEFIVRESTIGAGPAARRGIRTALSHPDAWSHWRSHLQEPPPGRPDSTPIAYQTIGGILRREEVRYRAASVHPLQTH